ncbi:Oidioi.mRNA.OKI2018_I69.chr2.g7349.t1.cds [Oikopleura dioica]|uniref:Oidioi.mRNA.OKI2018_I69.chr2.g7349.t1.cds n=1 Tax=Oikopleura dioica TaxID=34765 RepID=A0ABN7TBW4_OIKDI|nr:Oidioi.mRNA.OKI2018_I69.chr2.g7349.t1.cds [Oikopleura dioica]
MSSEIQCEDQKFMCRDESWLVQCNRIEKIRLLCPKTCGLCSEAGGTVNIVISGVKSIGQNSIPTLTPFESGNSNSALLSSPATPNSETVVQISSSSGFTFPVPGVVWYLVLLGTFLLVIAVGLIVIFERHHLRKLLGKKTYCCNNPYYLKENSSENTHRGDESVFPSHNATLERLGNQSTLPFPNPPPAEGSLSKELEKVKKTTKSIQQLLLLSLKFPALLRCSKTTGCISDLYGSKLPLNQSSRSYLPADNLTTVVSQRHLDQKPTSEVSGSGGSLSVNDEVDDAEAAEAEEAEAEANEAAEAGECIV